MVEISKKQWLTCPRCGSSVPVELTTEPGIWQERMVTCPSGHNILYDDRDLEAVVSRTERHVSPGP
jgi:hypothetical protein